MVFYLGAGLDGMLCASLEMDVTVFQSVSSNPYFPQTGNGYVNECKE
jgi:hypothetical protein